MGLRSASGAGAGHCYTVTTRRRLFGHCHFAACFLASPGMTDNMQPTFTIGIEEEYQTVDPETRDLRSHIHAEILEKGRMILQERVKAEMHQSVVEVGTSVCNNIKEAKAEVKKLRSNMVRLAKENGLRLASAATHPFSDWRTQEIHPDQRYKNIVEDMQLVARANLIFGLHVHVGIEDRETAIHMMNHARYFLPHILALSTNSPFWLGMNTGSEILSLQGFRQVSPDQHSRLLPQLGRIRKLHQAADQDQLHRQRQEDLVGHPAASILQHDRIPRLRHPDAGG